MNPSYSKFINRKFIDINFKNPQEYTKTRTEGPKKREPQECKNVKIEERKNQRTQELKNRGSLDFAHHAGILERKNRRMQESKNLRIKEYKNGRMHELKIYGHCAPCTRSC